MAEPAVSVVSAVRAAPEVRRAARLVAAVRPEPMRSAVMVVAAVRPVPAVTAVMVWRARRAWWRVSLGRPAVPAARAAMAA